ncbi:MAG: urease accessory protein UreE [Thermostichus sp. DG_1_6_bins_120]
MSEESYTPLAEGRHGTTLTVLQLPDEPKDGIPRRLEVVTLSWHDRQRSRQRLVSDQGSELQLMLPRGTHLHDGDLLYVDKQRQIRVQAQAEPVLLVQPENLMQMGQVLHQMGNWHRPVQISPAGQILVLSDAPLRDWLTCSGIPFQETLQPFHPNLLAHGH